MMRSRKLIGICIAAAMLATLLFFTLPLWSGNKLLYMGDIVNSDVTEYHYPVRRLIGEEIKDGNLPIWVPEMGCGFPLLAEGQSGMLYPPNLALFAALGPTLAFNLSVILSLLLALIFSYLLFRHYGFSRPSSLFAGIAFSFSGFVMAKIKFTYMVNAICWLPLAVYGMEKTFSNRNLKYLLLITLAFAMQILAGGAQILVITITAVAIIFIWRILAMLFAPDKDSSAGKSRIVIMFILGFVLCVVLALAVAAPQLLPQVSGFPEFNRSIESSFSWSLGVPMRPRNLVQFVSPYQFGNPARGTYNLEYDYFWENIAYPGLLTLVLALIALIFLCKKDRTLQIWLLIGVIALALALGGNTPLAELVWKYIPGFKMFRFWQRYLILVVLSISILAAAALDYIIAFFKASRTWHVLIIVLVFAVLLLDLGLFSYNQISTIDSARMQEDNQMAQWLQDNLGEYPGYRISILGEKKLWNQVINQSHGWLGDKELFYEYMEFIPPNINLLFDLQDAIQYGDYGLLYLKYLSSVDEFIYIMGEDWNARYSRTAVNILALESTKYLLSPLELDVEGLVKIGSEATDIAGINLNIYEVLDPLPRTFITQEYEVVPYNPLTIQQLFETLWDAEKVRSRVLLEKEPSKRYAGGDPGEAYISSFEDRRVVIEAASPGGGILTLNSCYYPEWRVLVDGEERPLLRTNYAFMGVELEPGKHTVEFAYRSTSFLYGILICIAGLLLLLLLWLYNRMTGLFDLNVPRGPRKARDTGDVHPDGVEDSPPDPK